MSVRGPCADCDPSSASTASVSSDLHKYHVACSCANGGPPVNTGQYAECAPTGPDDVAPQKIERPPALPPRPPPRPRASGNATRNGDNATSTSNNSNGSKKYVWWCMVMGTMACLLGGLLFAAAFVLRALTVSLDHLETIPTPIPATMLVLTGLCVMSLARRKNRYSYLIKIVGACCLVCALTCVLVTITTTVIHMNRLQTLRQCIYTDDTKTCVCSSTLLENQNSSDEESVQCVFEEVIDCNVVHGSLYRCLSAIFGLSIAGVLICICSAMLAYQLLSHERKKMYWEQLELRCRSLYRPAAGGQSTRSHNQQPQVCGECCTRCRAVAVANWDLQQRFWASGRVGNLYSPNPGTARRVSPWSWFPWARNTNQRAVGTSSGDSAYGFGNNPSGYWQLGPPPPYTPHHRYHHHHNPGINSSHHHLAHSHSPIHMPHGCTMINQSNRTGYHPNSLTPHGSMSDLEGQHHHHHQGSLRMGMAVCHQNSQMHSSVRVLQCHDSNMIMPLSPGHFVPINDIEGQSDDSIVHRVECHHQSNPNIDNFPDKTEEMHVTQHTCQKHKQHIDEDVEIVNAQGEENLAFQCEKQTLRQVRGGESELYFADVSSCCNVSLKTVEYCGGLVGTIETQADISSGDSDVTAPCPVFNNRPLRPRPNHMNHTASPRFNNNLWKKQSSPLVNCSSPNRIKKKTLAERNSPSVPLNSNMANLQCKSNTHFQDQPVCFNCSDNPSGRNSVRYGNEEDNVAAGIALCSDTSISNHSLDGSTRSSLRIGSAHRVLPSHMPNNNDLNDVGLPPITQMRKTIDESLVIINNDLNLSSVKKRSAEESLNSDNSMSDNIQASSSRCRNSDDSLIMNEINNSLQMQQNSRRSDDSLSCSPLSRKNLDEMNREDNSKITNRRKALDDSILSSDSNSSSPFRRMCLEDSPVNDESANAIVTPMRRKNVDSSLDQSIRRAMCDESPATNKDALNRNLNAVQEFNQDDKQQPMLLMKENNVPPSRRKAPSLDDHHVAKLNFIHMMQHNARYNGDVLDESSLAAESEGSRRGMVGGVCIAPDLRYEPVQGFVENAADRVVPMHMRCYSDSNTMDSGWQSGSERHVTD